MSWVDLLPAIVVAVQILWGKTVSAAPGHPTWPSGRWAVVVDRRDEPEAFWGSIVVQVLAVVLFYTFVRLR